MTDVINPRRGIELPRPAQHHGGVTATTDRPNGLAALHRLTWWTLVGCLIGVMAIIASEPPAPAAKAVVFAILLPVCAVAGRLFAVAVLGTPPPPTGVTVGAAVGAAGILLYSGAVGYGGFPWALPLAAVLAAVQAGTRWPAIVVWPAGVVLAFGASLAGSWSVGPLAVSGALIDAGITALCAVSLFAQVWMSTVAERLDRARATAVTGERRRFAAEPHDIQGHNLQVIALKSELAERLADTEPEQAVALMRDVQELARQALGDTRTLVSGYRAVALDTEITNAARVLHSAGIESSISPASVRPHLPPAVENLLGLVVRECTTNVLRHSSAHRCEIRLSAEAGTVVLHFVNDAPLDSSAGPGGGLSTLQERLATAGGSLRSVRSADCFTVTACLPVGTVR